MSKTRREYSAEFKEAPVSETRLGGRHHLPSAHWRFIYLAVILDAYTCMVRGWTRWT